MHLLVLMRLVLDSAAFRHEHVHSSAWDGCPKLTTSQMSNQKKKLIKLETEAETKRNEETVSSVVAWQSHVGDQND